jgi:hypothetical protein
VDRCIGILYILYDESVAPWRERKTLPLDRGRWICDKMSKINRVLLKSWLVLLEKVAKQCGHWYLGLGVISFVTGVIAKLDIIIETGGQNRFAPKKKDTIRISSY